jgi:hypothetical protein
LGSGWISYARISNPGGLPTTTLVCKQTRSWSAGSFKHRISPPKSGHTDKVFRAPSTARRGLVGIRCRPSSFLRGDGQLTLNPPRLSSTHTRRVVVRPRGCPRGLRNEWRGALACGTVFQGTGLLPREIRQHKSTHTAHSTIYSQHSRVESVYTTPDTPTSNR